MSPVAYLLWCSHLLNVCLVVCLLRLPYQYCTSPTSIMLCYASYLHHTFHVLLVHIWNFYVCSLQNRLFNCRGVCGGGARPRCPDRSPCPRELPASLLGPTHGWQLNPHAPVQASLNPSPQPPPPPSHPCPLHADVVLHQPIPIHKHLFGVKAVSSQLPSCQ